MSRMLIYLRAMSPWHSSEGQKCEAFTIPSCCGLGLHSRQGCPRRWWALTPPFHPYHPKQYAKGAKPLWLRWHWVRFGSGPAALVPLRRINPPVMAPFASINTVSNGGLLSVALSLTLRWPSVRRNPASLQPGLSSWHASCKHPPCLV